MALGPRRCLWALVLLGGCARPHPPPAPPPPAPPSKPPSVVDFLHAFDAERAFAHMLHLAEAIGPRAGGTPAERQAAEYIAECFRQYGYSVRFQEGILIPPVGRFTQNVIASKPSPEPYRLVVGAHADSLDVPGGSPGANDNAAGVGVMLEAARVLASASLPYWLEFVAFGAEETPDGNLEHHHYGSNAYVAAYLRGEMPGPPIVGMVSLDLIGVGTLFLARSMGKAPPTLQKQALLSARRLGLPLHPRGSGPWSDHEAFEEAGIPSVWFQRLWDPDQHTARDRPANVRREHLQSTGKLLLHLLLTLKPQELRP